MTPSEEEILRPGLEAFIAEIAEDTEQFEKKIALKLKLHKEAQRLALHQANQNKRQLEAEPIPPVD